MITVPAPAAARGYHHAVDRSRPRLHLLPSSGWLNDPNGLCKIDGTYHVFYQHNPYEPVHSDIHWGHASSTDLLNWTEEPIALTPRPGGLDANGCWSGCVVDDSGVPTAVYTAVGDTAQNAQVGLARSDRSLQSWKQEPVGRIRPPNNPAISEVRDPFVFTFEGHRYAVQGSGHTTGAPQLLLYACDDLDDWTYLGPLLTFGDPVAAEVAPANIWECPNLFRLGDRWVIILSLWRYRDGTDHLAGVRYLVGDLVPHGDGLLFRAESGGIVDHGPTFYAPQVLVDGDRVLLWGWAWEGAQRTDEEIAAAGWAGTLTFPRELVLLEGGLQSRPARELIGLHGEELTLGPDGIVGTPAFEIETEGPLQLILVDVQAGTRQPSAALPGQGRVLVDGSIVEVFGSGPSHTSRHYPTATSQWVVESDSPYRVWPLA